MKNLYTRGHYICLMGLAALILGTRCYAAPLSGDVTDENQKPVAGAQVVIPALQKGAVTDKDGKFSVDVPPGQYAVEVRQPDFATETRNVVVNNSGASLTVAMHSTPIQAAPITITAAPEARSTLTTPNSVSVVQGRELDRQRGESIMSAIQETPGVNMIDEGPTVVKPEIRGLQSQDVVVAVDGTREEFIQWGNEHAPEINAGGADRIEVLRGPNSLMYGSDALGGVISVSHPELPNAALGAGPLAGKVTAQVNSVNKSAGQGVELQGAQGAWGWRANLDQQEAGNFSTGNQGFIPNTGEHEVSGGGTLGVRKDWGSVTGDYSHFDKYVELQNGFVYPAPLLDSEYQQLVHDHGSLHFNIPTDLARFEIVTGYDRSDRQEYNGQSAVNGVPTQDGSDLGAHWIVTTYTGDLKAHLEPMGPFQGTLGVSALRRVEQQLTPTTHLTPGYNEDGFGEYLYEELPWEKFTFSAGLRGDQNHYDIDTDPLVGAGAPASCLQGGPSGPAIPCGFPMGGVQGQSLNYNAVTASLGGVYHITDPLAFAVDVGRGYRNPVPFELFGNGVHEGAGVYQLGNPGLKPENSLNTEASIRWASDRIKGEIGVFRDYIQDYIYGTFTGNWVTVPGEGTLPIVNETQTNATIKGVEYAITGAATNWLTLKSVGNLVRGYNNSNDPSLPNQWIPHVPADNLLVGADVHQKRILEMLNPYFGMDVKFTNSQQRASPYELQTPGYVLVGAHTGTEFLVMNNRVTLDAGVTNLFNKGYIDYNSILKNFNIENPGRNVYVKVGVPFGS